jgi:hypothetical protein
MANSKSAATAAAQAARLVRRRGVRIGLTPAVFAAPMLADTTRWGKSSGKLTWQGAESESTSAVYAESKSAQRGQRAA